MKKITNFINKNKKIKKDNKGFTLIEIVIVIVIIAILAAMLVPSMLTWIDKANQRTFLSAADTIKTSVTTKITDNYASGNNIASQDDLKTNDWKEISDLVGKTVAKEDAEYNVTFTCTKNNITKMTIASSKYTIDYENNAWSEVTSID